jgi:hypothetical protein
MKSHEYEFTLRDLVPLIAMPLIPLALFAVVMHVGASMAMLPKPRPTLDTDRTILFHQAEASRSQHDANLVIIGDSSSLMDVSAPTLQTALPSGNRTLSLGTLSYLDLHAYASILKHYLAANPGRLRHVVLLLHPEALRRVAPTEYHVNALNHYYAGEDFCDPSIGPFLCWVGGEIFRGRILSRTVPSPLGGHYGKSYGFSADLWRYLSQNQGSAVDPGKFDPKEALGNAEYRLSKQLEAASKEFKAEMPAGVKLSVGITPTPESFVPPGFDQKHKEMLRDWNVWLQADVILSELPATLPDRLFAGTAHLSAEGQRLYTDLLARVLAPHLLKP